MPSLKFIAFCLRPEVPPRTKHEYKSYKTFKNSKGCHVTKQSKKKEKNTRFHFILVVGPLGITAIEFEKVRKKKAFAGLERGLSIPAPKRFVRIVYGTQLIIFKNS